MCRPASFVVTKKEVFWSKNSESHEGIIEEFKLKELDVRGNPTFVRVEIVPPENDYCLPFSKWVYSLDQDIKPDWYDAQKSEKQVRAKLKEWRKCKVVMPSEKREKVDVGQIVAIYGQVESIYGSAQVESIYGSAQVRSIYGSAKVRFISGSAKVRSISGSAQVESIYGSAQVRSISGSAQVRSIYGSAQVGSIYGSAQVRSIYGSAQVRSISGSAQVGFIKGKSVVASYNNLSPSILKSSQAVLIDRTKDPVVCYVGKDT